MRRFSQRQGLVTLNDINITPLLDLAFVLLIIFIITTPLLEQGINLNLPDGGLEDSQSLEPTDIRTVDVGPDGWYFVAGEWQRVEQVMPWLVQERSRNPKLLVYVRADEELPYKYVALFLSQLEKTGFDQVSLRTEPQK